MLGKAKAQNVRVWSKKRFTDREEGSPSSFSSPSSESTEFRLFFYVKGRGSGRGKRWLITCRHLDASRGLRMPSAISQCLCSPSVDSSWSESGLETQNFDKQSLFLYTFPPFPLLGRDTFQQGAVFFCKNSSHKAEFLWLACLRSKNGAGLDDREESGRPEYLSLCYTDWYLSELPPLFKVGVLGSILTPNFEGMCSGTS